MIGNGHAGFYVQRPIMCNPASVARVSLLSAIWGGRGAAHNYRPSRNARSASDGRYRPGLVPSGAVRAIAFSFSAGSACS